MITPAVGLNPDVNQIYPIVNAVYRQMTGLSDIEAVDTASLVSMGSRLGELGKLDLYLNSLARRIGRTIDSYRVYTSRYSDLSRSQLEWGAYVQKITAEMPEAVDNLIYEVGKMDGKSVDQWIISNPKVHQRIFDKETPYSFFITMQTKLLREAFLSSGAMSSFINQIFGKVQNKIAFVHEELGRLCVNNMILAVNNKQHYHLVSMYNSEHANKVNTGNAMQSADFLRYCSAVFTMVSDGMTGMSVLYNSDGFQRFTPKEAQRFYILSDFMNRLKTVVSYAAFHKEDVSVNPSLLVPYWQAAATVNDPDGYRTKTTIMGSVKNTETGASIEKTLENVIGIMFDWDSMGTFREEQEVLTTPVNARAAYYNTFWHENQLWYNDLSENCAVFFLD